MRQKLIQVFEHNPISVATDSAFEGKHFRALVRYNEKHGNKYFSVGNRTIWFGSHVGVLQVGELIIEILPKADLNAEKQKWHNALLEMLRVTKRVRVDSLSNAHLKVRRLTLMDIYLESFLSLTEKLVREGLVKRYHAICGNLPYLKGRIDFNRHISSNILHKERFFTVHEKYDCNNLFNGILKQALILLAFNTTNPFFKNRIKELLLHFEGVIEQLPEESEFDRLRFDRKTERYREAITIARMIICNYSPDITGGANNVVAILFDMNKVFEEYVFRLLQSTAARLYPGQITFTAQKRIRFWQDAAIRPDIIAEIHESEEKRTFVIDTKWKIPQSQRPADGDLKQAFVYNLYCKSLCAILLYPQVALENIGPRPFAQFGESPERYCQLYFASLFDKNSNLSSDWTKMFIQDVLLHKRN